MILLLEVDDADAARVLRAVPDGVVTRGADCGTWAKAAEVCQKFAGGGWRRIGTAPLDGTRVLVWVGETATTYGAVPATCRGEGFGWLTDECDLLSDPDPTHWMPLPGPPTPSPR